MSSILHIEVANKVATFSRRDGVVVCGNTDYLVKFTFDSEWSGVTDLTARFVWNDQYSDVPITNNECYMPVVKDTTLCKVGVYSGGKKTTTPAIIPCRLSVLCGNPTESPDMPIRELIEGTLVEVTPEMIQGATKIRDEAFYASTVKKVAIPNSVKTIGQEAFYKCANLTSIVIPESVTSIGIRAFRDCTKLSTVTFAENSQLQTVGDYVFLGCTRLTSITIPASLQSTGVYMFSDCTGLTYVSFAENGALKRIGTGTFIGCTSLTSITLPEGVESIGGQAFKKCTNLYEVTIPDGVTSIGNEAFYECALYGVTIPASVTTIRDGAFQHCNNLNEITIPAGVTTIGSRAFQNSYLYSVKFEGQPVFSAYAFGGWSGVSNTEKYDFRGATSVPTLPAASALGHASGCQIIVPDALYDAWKAKTNWSALTGVVWVKASEYTEE